MNQVRALVGADHRQPAVGHGLRHRLAGRQRERKLADEGQGGVDAHADLHADGQRHAGLHERGAVPLQMSDPSGLRNPTLSCADWQAASSTRRISVLRSAAPNSPALTNVPPPYSSSKSSRPPAPGRAAVAVEDQHVIPAVAHGLDQRLEGRRPQQVDDHRAGLVERAQAVQELLARARGKMGEASAGSESTSSTRSGSSASAAVGGIAPSG